MAITHSLAARQASGDAVLALLNGGTTDPAGDLRFITGAAAEVAILPLSNPAFGAVDGTGVATANAVTPDTTTIAGTVATFELRNRDNAIVISGTVGLVGSGADIELTSVTYSNNETITVSSLTYTSQV